MNCVGLSIALPLFSRLSGTTPDGRAVAEVGEVGGGEGSGGGCLLKLVSLASYVRLCGLRNSH